MRSKEEVEQSLETTYKKKKKQKQKQNKSGISKGLHEIYVAYIGIYMNKL